MESCAVIRVGAKHCAFQEGSSSETSLARTIPKGVFMFVTAAKGFIKHLGSEA